MSRAAALSAQLDSNSRSQKSDDAGAGGGHGQEEASILTLSRHSGCKFSQIIPARVKLPEYWSSLCSRLRRSKIDSHHLARLESCRLRGQMRNLVAFQIDHPQEPVQASCAQALEPAMGLLTCRA
jgi:hypothetical protein